MEIEYYSEIKKILVEKNKYKNFEYFIMNLGRYPTAYVKLNKDQFNRIKTKDIKVHGGITFETITGILINKFEKVDGCFIGWDYAHFGDFDGLSIKYPYLYTKGDKKYTKNEIEEECKDVINQITTQLEGVLNE